MALTGYSRLSQLDESEENVMSQSVEHGDSQLPLVTPNTANMRFRTIARQVLTLLTKELRVISRTKLWFLLEMLIGLLLLPLIFVVVGKTGSEMSDGVSFDPVLLSGNSSDVQQQVKNIPRIFSRWCGSPKILAYSGDHPNLDEFMAKVQARYHGERATLRAQVQPNAETMRQTLLRDLADTKEKICGKYIGGIYFEEFSITMKTLRYRILFPKRMEQKWHLDEFWPEDGAYGAVADLNNIPGEPPYWSSGFLSVQYAVEHTFLEMLGTPINTPLYLQRMPSPPFRNSGMVAFLKQTPNLWSILVLMTIVHTVKNVVAEKDAGIKSYMMVMGLNSVSFYGSHLMIGVMKAGFIMALCAGAFSSGLLYVDSTLFVSFSLLFATSAIMFAILVSSLVRKPSLALIVAIVGWILLLVADHFYTVTPTRLGACFLASLNVYSAFKLGIKATITAETTTSYLGWTNMFLNSNHSFTFGLAMLMLLFDLLLMTLLALYFDAVFPTDSSPRKHPWFMFGYSWADSGRFESEARDEVDNQNDENVEPDGAMGKDEADIEVQGLSKVWEGTGQRAVDNLTFRAYRGQVTVLLGPNGAGKSTTFSVISGSSAVTTGHVYICKEDIQRNLEECQRQLGFCPQYNPLFAKLTVREHLRFYAKLKSDDDGKAIDQDIDAIAQQVQLKSHLDTLAENLSGGMKRKLCVAMALIGDSRVILLDEPTAGMDPEARHDVRLLLERAKRNRTILLTTHYMDEADLLGDRIGIMVKGRMVCNGSPEFLKHRFGTGYILSLVVDQTYIQEPFQTTADRILRVARKHSADAKLDNLHPPEFAVILPVHHKQYPHVLQLRQLTALLDRHWINLIRNKWRTIAPVVISLLLFTLFAGFGRYNTGTTMEYRDLSLLSQEPLSVPLIVSQSASASLHLPFMVGQLPNARLVSLSPLSNMNKELTKRWYDQHPLGFGANLMGNDTILALFNGAAFHTPSLAVQLITNAAIKASPRAVQMSVEVYDAPQQGGDRDQITTTTADSNLVVAIIVILAFSSLSSTFVMPLVEDNVTRFKHQLLLTKLRVCTYWISLIVWHALLYILFCSMLTSVFLIFGWMKGCLLEIFLLWTLFFWCCIPFVYCASFIFNSSVKAYAALLCWNVVVSVIALITDVTLEALQLRVRDIFHYFAFLTLPAFSLGNGMVQIAIHAGIPDLPSGTVFEAIKQVVYCMLASGTAFWTLLAILESKKIARLTHSLHCKIRKNQYQIVNTQVDGEVECNEDEDVVKERESVRAKEDSDFALAVRDVYKYYGDFCALRGLTFGVKQTDCFGLLGVNGAGKTTTFSILTGEMFATAGRATIERVDVTHNPVIGYCPQFDALAPDLTGREVLTLLGRLNGFQDVHGRVDRVLQSIRMTQNADKLVQFYSGGQKRRLSIGVTLMSRSSFIMLDEPTAGIDPSTRRKIWQLIQAVRKQNVAILLTSHSMEECEALCNRIGFMNKGALISIGSSQHLKSRYGNSFLLTFTIANPSLAVSRYLDQMVTSEFNAKSTSDPAQMPTQHWEIPRLADQTWSGMFRKAQAIADRHPAAAILPPASPLPRIKDFSLTQNSLEQVFLRLAKASQTDPRDPNLV